MDVLGEEFLLAPLLLVGRFVASEVNVAHRPCGSHLCVGVVGRFQKLRVAEIDGGRLFGGFLGSSFRRRSVVT
jgi:hypothetical protein